jgi:hypothetical protein
VHTTKWHISSICRAVRRQTQLRAASTERSRGIVAALRCGDWWTERMQATREGDDPAAGDFGHNDDDIDNETEGSHVSSTSVRSLTLTHYAKAQGAILSAQEQAGATSESDGCGADWSWAFHATNSIRSPHGTLPPDGVLTTPVPSPATLLRQLTAGSWQVRGGTANEYRLCFSGRTRPVTRTASTGSPRRAHCRPNP